MQEGVVRWFDNKKGFGFIESLSRDYFVHFIEIKGDGYRRLHRGMRVSFEPKETSKGSIAVGVEII